MTEPQEFDVVIIGAGAVGENAADRVVQGGLTAVLVEAELVGGECSYWACMPSKALLRSGTALLAAQSVAGSREAVTGTLDASAVFKRRDTFTSNWQDDGQADWVRDAGIELLRGHAWLTGERTVEVATNDGGTHHLRARHAVVLATGSTPTVPPLPGLSDIHYWGTREATSAQTVPNRLAVLGGGVSGAELAQAYARLGSAVTLVARGELLAMYPRDARELVAAGLRSDGVDLRLNTSSTGVSRNDAGEIVLDLEGGQQIVADELLVSTGRHPALEGLGLESLGLGTEKLDTDTTGRVAGHDWLYAVGDAASKVLLTHQGKYEARATGSAIAARAAGELQGTPEPWSRCSQTADDHAVPNVVFTDPEIAMVGLSLDQARSAGINASEVSLPIAVGGSSLYADDYKGWAQLVVDEDRKVLVGAIFAGPGVAELLHSATVAVVGQVPMERLWHAVPSYPTISEVWLRLLEKYGL
ncbi:NAD(P)/FAD-dependent oxidoreductase [Paenarthrobacter sp. Z7-10]|uniref:dihydrolipoyl dehydrogenase family protein n=1 Tax=Paenarthrobacter sp. Z7-10 TaxID=2787635 RepID=UPI0022A95309|nr:NAD(P)/FAD-dependent oxidoreductase [Paenarthrobacter sp. Z7-10]MCZ2402813.1 NAD(P)/FAD-dependent oxidoreductase [Paenarthrobacter sp. Z7-10]